MYLFLFMDNLLRVSSTLSTNDDAYQLAQDGAEHGFGVLAETQLGGKGRLGKTWASPARSGLYCSIILRPQLAFSEFPKLTLTAGLALCSAVEVLLPDVAFGLKWPNDLFSGGQKCGGILVESSSNVTNDDPFVVVGIGLNVNTTPDMFPYEIKQKATSLHILSGQVFNLAHLYNSIHDELLTRVNIHEKQGFEIILGEWRRRDILFGKEMQWVTREKKIITACGMGPNENGELLAKDRNGRIYEILSGDVKLAE
ncbi:birA, biotin-(acetyl-CoA-carboxylase) ligase [Desulfocapsa sulfexigens DSM 10523]|uniref:BirA, biotin-(Acetyl-CoA-carboxylase) ligase n=1 Tax=Desulfocapsa sulfexigens (strain DSM 10523 / SB164P1) TaxID=1167006 RepID=M1NEQ7_DESSD|nr:biotin--[acetyl-CoA-carboxylase] ligase [Desulfocapsa sulfexigens]AGF78194.1 birA, biotin-(acetyl-CoA-carboxylase) ligase [Desulfocapsa sulfexigens DSM 10523]